MDDFSIITILILILNFGFTFKGLDDYSIMDKYAFNIEKVLVNKEYYRLITSGFLHVNWIHFGFNMITFYLFSPMLETLLGTLPFLLLYITSLIGGNLLALFIHRNHPDYTAIGASGAVSGMVFASIGLIPGLKLGLLFLPIFLPAWFFGLVYIIYTIYGIKSKKDNIGHEAHLGGGIIGMILALILIPEAIKENYITILILLIPSMTFILLIFYKPHILLIPNVYKRENKVLTFEDKYNHQKMEKEEELNMLLDKIHKKGLDKLSAKEKKRLDELSK